MTQSDLADRRFNDIFGAGRSGGPGGERRAPLSRAELDEAFAVNFANGRQLHFPYEYEHANALTHIAWVTDSAGGNVIYDSTVADWQTDPTAQLDNLARALCPTTPIDAEEAGDGCGPEVQAISAHTDETVRFPAPGEPCDYARICTRLGEELAYWNSDEFAEDPILVLGALVGALQDGVAR